MPTPLTTILGFSELLLREGKSTNPARLEKIHSEAERSVRIIQNVLRLAREVNPHVDPQPEIASYVADGTFERMLE